MRPIHHLSLLAAHYSCCYDLASVAYGTCTTHYAWVAGRLTNVTWQAGTASGSVHYEYTADSGLSGSGLESRI